MVRLSLVQTATDVDDAVAEFDRFAKSWDYAQKLVRTTSYWVFNPTAGTFGPSKFVGYSALDSAAYEGALAGDFEGPPFDGNLARKAVEAALQRNFERDEQLSARLVAWGEATFGPGIFARLDTSKWRFVTLPLRASRASDDALETPIEPPDPDAEANDADAVSARIIHAPDGTPLDARFALESIDGRLSIVVAPRGGSRGTPEARNVDYARGVEVLLARLGDRQARILDATVESRATQHLALVDRRLDIEGRPYPIRIDDAADLQRRIGAAQARVGREQGARGSGNRTKRVRLVFEFAAAAPSVGTLEDFLAGGQGSRSRRTSPRRALVGRTYENVGRLNAVEPRQPFDVDPDKVDRGNQAHATTQDALADFLRARGFDPLKPREGGPRFDLAWRAGEIVYVAEVKSTTEDNGEQQLRLGLGQVLRYRYLLAGNGVQVKPVLVAEREPTDSSWVATCDELGVLLTWPGAFERIL